MAMTIDQLFEAMNRRFDALSAEIREVRCSIKSNNDSIENPDEVFENEISSCKSTIVQPRENPFITVVSVINHLGDTPNEVIEQGEFDDEDIILDGCFSSDVANDFSSASNIIEDHTIIDDIFILF